MFTTKRISIHFLIVTTGILTTLSIRGAVISRSAKANREAINYSQVLLSHDPEKLEGQDHHVSSHLAEDPGDFQSRIWWTRTQIARDNASALILLLESEELAGNDLGRFMLIRLGDLFARDLDIAHFRMAWQQAGVWHIPPQSRWRTLVEVAREAILEEDWGRALELLRILETWQPEDIKVNRYLAEVLLNGYGDLAGAITEREDVVASSPDSYWDQMSLGHLYVEADRLDDAQDAFERAYEIDPSSERSVTGLAGVFREKGNLYQAANVMEEFLRLHHDNDFVLVRLAGVYQDQGRGVEAVGLLEAFLERNPNNVPALVTLGAFYEREGQVEKAIALIEHALHHDGEPYYIAWGHDLLARIALSMGDDELASFHSEQASVIRASQGSE